MIYLSALQNKKRGGGTTRSRFPKNEERFILSNKWVERGTLPLSHQVVALTGRPPPFSSCFGPLPDSA